MSDRLPWIIAGLAIPAGGAVAYFMFGGGAPAPQPAPPPSPPIVDAGVVVDAGATEDAAVDEATPQYKSGDAGLRAAARRGSKLLRRWAGAPGILQRLTAAVRLISQGRSPKSVLGFIDLDGRFEVKETLDPDAPIYIAKKSYRRYDKLTNAFTSIEPAELARAYRGLRPHFARTYAQVAGPDESFDAALNEAIEEILEVKFPKKRIQVIEKGAIFEFADPKLEAMSPAQKHLLRMGPKNGKRIQKMLRAFSAS